MTIGRIDPFTLEAFRRLADAGAGPCLSIYLPAAEPGVRRTAQRLEQILVEAKDLLRTWGQSRTQVLDLLAPAHQIAAELELRPNDRAALAILAAPGMFTSYRLTYPVRELVLLGPRFHLKPLVPLFIDQAPYYLLTLSKSHAQLFRGAGASLDPLTLPGAPVGLGDTLQYDEFEKQYQFHSGVPGYDGKRSAVFHGQGDAKESLKPELKRYCRQVDDALQRAIGYTRLPLVLAGVEYLVTIYRAISAYPNILAAAISGSPERMPDADLGARAWALVQPQLQQPRLDALERYQELSGGGGRQTSSAIRLILPAALSGQVDTVFVALDREQWGHYEVATGHIVLHDQQQLDDEDLLNEVVIQTIRHGGMVYALPFDAMPDGGLCAAVLRGAAVQAAPHHMEHVL